MGRFITGSAQQTADLGERLGATLRGGEVIAFTGGMGVGKTTFCRGLAKGLGVLDPVQSPTYAIVNYYRGPIPLAHFDVWRVEGPEDLETAGYYDYLDSGAVIAVEWSEKISAALEDSCIRVDIRPLEEGEREIKIEGAAL